jgi:hypothetical protein
MRGKRGAVTACFLGAENMPPNSNFIFYVMGEGPVGMRGEEGSGLIVKGRPDFEGSLWVGKGRSALASGMTRDPSPSTSSGSG